MIDLTLAILIASAAVYSWKLLGNLVPSNVLKRPVIARLASLLTVALLAALVGIQAFTDDAKIVLDVRAAALVVAGLLAWRKAPFIVIVASAAATAAILRIWF